MEIDGVNEKLVCMCETFFFFISVSASSVGIQTTKKFTRRVIKRLRMVGRIIQLLAESFWTAKTV